jgi:endoglucanase
VAHKKARHDIKHISSKLKDKDFSQLSFSLTNLIIFLAIFAAIGGYIIYSSFAATSGVTVSGPQLLKDNQPFIMRGVNRSGTEYMCRTSAAVFDGPNGLNDSSQITLMKSWGVNTVNIPFNESCWLGINGAAYGGVNYQNALKTYVSQLEANGMTPVLALFWTAPGSQLAGGHGTMPDSDHTPLMWQSVANTFKNDPYVVFRIDEEPHPGGNIWDCWKNGDVQFAANGTLTPVSSVKHCSESFSTVGMQSIVNIIRGTGATNVLQIPGPSWSNSFNNFLNPTYKIADTLSPAQLMASADIYPIGNSCDTGCNTTTYNNIYGPITQVMPFVAGEIGPDVDASSTNMSGVDTLLDWLDQHNSGYLAWEWDVWGNTDDLISSYSTGAAKSPWGVDFKNHLARVGANPTPLVTLTANPASVALGSASTLTWSSTNATSCVAVSPVNWTTSTATSGSQNVTNITAPTTYTISCTGSNGSAQGSATVTINDSTPPTVSLTAPANGATVSNSVTVSANATDNIGVAGVQFKLDNSNLGSEDTAPPYSITWNTAGVSNGAHIIKAVARDAAGNSTTSALVSVTTNNNAIVINDNTTGTGINQLNYSAGWNYDNTDANKYQGDDHYSTTAGSTATISFSGTLIKVYATTDVHHGVAAFSIDGGAENSLSEYSASRAYQALIYSSPTLSSGSHTLTMRVTGNNGTGGGNTITLDKITISLDAGVNKVGDINHDGLVNIFDLSTLLSNYNSTTASCDLNSDGIVNIFDLSMLLTSYGL